MFSIKWDGERYRVSIPNYDGGDVLTKEEHEQALAEKDFLWKRRVGLDCGGHSCFYAIDKTGMRHNGPCFCNPKRTKEDYDRLYQDYQQLMEKALKFAETVVKIHDFYGIESSDVESSMFLHSSEVQAWKEQQK